jgi:hypothetical protein
MHVARAVEDTQDVRLEQHYPLAHRRGYRLPVLILACLITSGLTLLAVRWLDL